MRVVVVGDENEIEIQVEGKTYTGDLHEMSEEEDGPEIWNIDGLLLESEQILCLQDLECLALEFLEKRGIAYSEITVRSDSFRE